MRLLISFFTFVILASGGELFASRCNGIAYTTIDNGYFLFEKVRAEYIPGAYRPQRQRGEPVRFVFKDQSRGRWVAYRYRDEAELLQSLGYNDSAVKLTLDDMTLDRSMVTMLMNRTAVGVNLLCRL